MASIELIPTLKLSLQRALLGAVTGNLYAVTCGAEEDRVCIHVYFYSQPSEEEVECISVVASEVTSDLSAGFMVDEQCFDATEQQPKMLDFWVFMRKENPLIKE